MTELGLNDRTKINMSGQQGYIYQKNNKLLTAAMTANVKDSGKRPLIYPVTKKGNGNIKLYGDYNGPVDAKYDIKVLDTALDTPHVSAPVFKGAGTGRLSGINVSGLAAQGLTVLCISTGTDTVNAEAEIEGLKFKAKAAGSAGNSIYIIIDDSNLIFTGTDYALINELKVGDTGLTGQEWDWDTKALSGDLIPEDAHRVAFGQNKIDIYLQYKKFEDGEWKYYFIPEIRRSAAVGDKVYFVTGGRKVTITDGVVSEEYTKIRTIAELWQVIKDNSALIEPVASSIDTTRAVTSPAVQELSVKTNAYFLPPYKHANSSEYAGILESIGITNNAKTELIEIKCVDNSYIGSEIWDVKGSASGDMGQAQSGSIFNFGYVYFTIPQKFPADWGTLKADWSHKVNYVSRAQGVDPPPICFNMKLGIASKPQTLTLEYKKRPAECYCPPVSFSEECLGLTEEGGEIGMAYTVEDLLYWTDVVDERMREQLLTGNQISERVERGSLVGYHGSIPYDYSDSAYYKAITEWTDKYFSIFKTLAQRIINLPEDNPATLTSMVDQYKQLVNSLTLKIGSATITWDGTVWSSQFTAITGGGTVINDISYDTDLFQTIVDSVLNYEKTYGVKKNSIIAPGTCYIDSASGYYWEVRGSKAYLPAFTDVPFYSTIKSGDEYINTQEFAFLISAPCGGSLIEGDIIEVTIGELQYEHTYQIGDLTYLPTIAKQDLQFTGGIDGDDTYVFEVAGEINSFPDYLLDRDNPAGYVHPKLSFLIADGAVPFSVGDSFEFSIEGGHFIWRKDSGAWSSPVNIEQEIQSFDLGLMIGFDFGVSPSFVVNDTWEVLCVQNNKTANLTDLLKSLKWSGNGYVTVDMGSSVPVDALIIDGHDISSDFTFKASDASDFSVVIYSEVISPSAIICKLFSPAVTARYFRLELSGDREIGYFFLGDIMQLSLDCDSITPQRKYQMERQDGEEPFSLMQYAQKGYSVGYNSFIYNADFDLIEEIISYLKSNNDQPFYFVPNINYPEDCIRARIDTDNIEFGSAIDINAPKTNRIFSLSLPLIGS